MGNSLENYISHLQLIAFFAGYPIVYSVVKFATADKFKKRQLINTLVTLLPCAYALCGLLFLGLLLKEMSPGFSVQNITEFFQSPLTLWGVLAILFFFPAFRKKTVFSLLHSLVFFVLFARDIFINTSLQGNDKINNEMKLYTISILLNLAALATIFLIHFFLANLHTGKKTAAK